MLAIASLQRAQREYMSINASQTAIEANLAWRNEKCSLGLKRNDPCKEEPKPNHRPVKGITGLAIQ